jgi:hypothetical protein
MLLVTSADKTLLTISQNGINQITLNKQLGNHLSMDIIMLPSLFPVFLLMDASWYLGYQFH